MTCLASNATPYTSPAVPGSLWCVEHGGNATVGTPGVPAKVVRRGCDFSGCPADAIDGRWCAWHRKEKGLV